MHQCPKCRSPKIHHSRAKSTWERWRRDITGKRPFRCSACGWRGWGIDQGPTFSDADLELASRAVAPEPPNLRGTALASAGSVRRAIDLRALDTFELPDDTRE